MCELQARHIQEKSKYPTRELMYTIHYLSAVVHSFVRLFVESHPGAQAVLDSR